MISKINLTRIFWYFFLSLFFLLLVYPGTTLFLRKMFVPPSVPIQLIAVAVSSSQISLSWAASSDDVGVVGYDIYKNGTQITTTTNNSYYVSGLNASTTYSFTVSAHTMQPEIFQRNQIAQAQPLRVYCLPRNRFSLSLQFPRHK